MLRGILCASVALLCACGAAAPAATAQPAPPTATAPDEAAADLSFLTDLVETRQFTLGRPVAPRFLPDGSQVLFLRASARSPVLELYGFDVAGGQTRRLLAPADVLGSAEEKLGPEERARRERMRVTLGGFTGFDVAADGRSVLVALGGKIYTVPLGGGGSSGGSGGGSGGGKAAEVAGLDAQGHPPFDARLSPDGKLVAFVRGNQLFTVPAAGGAPRSIARATAPDVQVAQAEFVAQEEMDRYTGYWWSPDSTQIVYQTGDTSRVEKLFVGDPADPTIDAGPVPYPRPGHPNVDVELFIVAASGGKPTPVPWDHARYPYLTDVVWDAGGPLAIEVMTRDQKDLALLAVDAKTGKSRELWREHDDVWLNLRPEGCRKVIDLACETAHFLRDGSFLWASERGGAWQLELHAPDGKLVRALTAPELGYRGLRHVDEAKRTVVVAAGAEPVDDELWRVPLDGGAAARIVDGDAVFSDGGAYVLDRWSLDRIYDPTVYRADGSEAGALPSVAEKPPERPRATVQKVGPAPGYWTSIVRPRDFDPKKKYPVVVEVYGGPHGVVVHKRLLGLVEPQFLADHGFIVVSVDNAGTPRRGRAWERKMFGHFIDLPIEGQVAGLRALAAIEPAMDLRRVGMIGGSFGGYMSALAVLRRPDVYRAAVARSPVSDWLDYDTFYTERYLGVPNLEAPKTYEENGLLVYAKDLVRPLLIVHGTADDNVHFSHALELANALFQAGRPFEFLPLTRTTHLPHEPHLMLRYYQRVFAFFRAHL